MIVGIGIDIIEVDRIRRLTVRHGERFLRRVFTDEEVDYCQRSAHPAQRFATRFAAKEATLKALGVGWQKGVTFRDVEVCVDGLGAPSVRLGGRALEISRERGVKTIFVSLSHGRHYAVAQALAEGQ